ncbi:MAG: hypothetical protein IPJ98_24470 [Bryobacterales bacterium]|nr:hypothetical protein [Bryobacterales bacterium]
MHRLWQSFRFALAVGLLNHAAVIAGLLNLPWLRAGSGAPQSRHPAIPHLGHRRPPLLMPPNFHAPRVTEPALFQPMLQPIGKSACCRSRPTISNRPLLYWAAAWAFLAVFETFFCATSRQRLWSSLPRPRPAF